MPVLSRSGGVVTGFCVQAAWLLGSRSGGVVTGFALGGVVVGSVEWVLSLRDLLTALSPNPSAGYPQKRSRFCGVRPVGKGLYTPPSGVNAGFASSGVVIPISENNLAVLARLAVLSVLSSARRLASLISGIGITRKEIRSRSADFFIFAKAKASVLGVVPVSSPGQAARSRRLSRLVAVPLIFRRLLYQDSASGLLLRPPILFAGARVLPRQRAEYRWFAIRLRSVGRCV